MARNHSVALQTFWTFWTFWTLRGLRGLRGLQALRSRRSTPQSTTPQSSTLQTSTPQTSTPQRLNPPHLNPPHLNPPHLHTSIRVVRIVRIRHQLAHLPCPTTKRHMRVIGLENVSLVCSRGYEMRLPTRVVLIWVLIWAHTHGQFGMLQLCVTCSHGYAHMWIWHGARLPCVHTHADMACGEVAVRAHM